MTYEKYLADGYIHCQALDRLMLDKALALRGKSAAIQVLVARYNVAVTDYRVACNRNQSGYETPETKTLKEAVLDVAAQIGTHADVKFYGDHTTSEHAHATYTSPREARAKRQTAIAFRRWERSEA